MRANTPPPVPRLKLLRVRDPGAPRAPGAAALKQLFQNVWRMVPPSRRPKLADRQAMAVDVLVVSDDRMAALNAAHLKHKGPTDVLAFSMEKKIRNAKRSSWAKLWSVSRLRRGKRPPVPCRWRKN